MITTRIDPIFNTSAAIAIPRLSDLNPIHARNIPTIFMIDEQPAVNNAAGTPAIPMINAINANIDLSNLIGSGGLITCGTTGADSGLGGAGTSGISTTGGVEGMASA